MDVRLFRNELFPEIESYEQGMLAVDRRHTLYWEQSGNPEGAPVVFLHGGPGAGAAAAHRRFFDPRHYRIIIFDQRGCGRSRPQADIVDNTTDHLLADMERLRCRLGVERWMLFGGSWGSTLALAYATRHPERCTGLILRGVFLGSRREVDWFLYGMGTFFPEAWRVFSEFLPKGERGDLLAGYRRRLEDPDPAVHQPAAAAWSRYETVCSNLIPRRDTAEPSFNGAGVSALALARIEAHYFAHDVFLGDAPLLARVDRLAGLPGVIVQGRYDMVCPIVSADALARGWPYARLVIVPDAGHSAMEPGIRAALVAATEDMKATNTASAAPPRPKGVHSRHRLR
ncbi:MAG: prolyl aminopeptidase [Rhodospirillales bacterium]